MRDGDGVFLAPCGFVELEAHAEQADDAAGGDEARSIQRTWRYVAFRFRAAGFFEGCIDHPADHTAGEDGESRPNAEIRAHGE